MKITKFQQKVLNYILKIPKGEIRSYKEVAKGINHPKAIRAVATACKRNPFPIQIPCHRVIKSNGDIGKYSGPGGIKAKIKLLKKEGFIK